MLCIKKKLHTGHGLFLIGAVVLNENESWEKDVPPVCAEHDFMIRFVPEGKKGVVTGKKHFSTIEEAEAFVWALDVAGFSRGDL